MRPDNTFMQVDMSRRPLRLFISSFVCSCWRPSIWRSCTLMWMGSWGEYEWVNENLILSLCKPLKPAWRWLVASCCFHTFFQRNSGMTAWQQSRLNPDSCEFALCWPVFAVRYLNICFFYASVDFSWCFKLTNSSHCTVIWPWPFCSSVIGGPL